MTETSPLGSVSAHFRIEMRLTDDGHRELPHDGKTAGQLLVRGVAVASAYYCGEDDILDAEGFFDTGDIATIDQYGAMQITDRAKDVIKSGGEWISSIEIENIALSHSAVANAAAVGMPHSKWDERPVLVVEAKVGSAVTADDLRAVLVGRIAKWWMPDDCLFIEAIPLGATGKIDKAKVRKLLSKVPGEIHS
jgi:fatty-acyl-CoA synthase